MMKLYSALVGVMLVAAASAQPVAWPDGKHAAVVLTYDDALTSQLEIAMPALDAAGLKGTFFLSGAGLKPDQIARWRAAAAAGHELGNHTIVHACAKATFPAPERSTAESYTVDAMLAEVRVMNTMLTAIDGKMDHSYATPCGQHAAGGVDYLPALRADGHVRFTRGVAGRNGAIDPMDVPSRWFDQTDKAAQGAAMIAAVQQAERTGGLLVIGFHGVGGDYLSVSAEAHAELVAFLKAHHDTIWVAPFSTVMDYATTHPGN